MPSKKKKKSKGRGKAVRKADEQQRSLDTQTERLKIDKDEDSQTNGDEDALLEEAIKLAAAEKDELDAASAEMEYGELEVCRHGYVKTTEEEEDYVILLVETFLSDLHSPGRDTNFGRSLGVANCAVAEKYPRMWQQQASTLPLVVSFLSSYAAHLVLQGRFDVARLVAAMVSFFEEFKAVISGERAKPNTTVAFELFKCTDERTIVKFLRQRIPCSCLDKIYKEVKPMAKFGVCRNPQCSSEKVERSKMFRCTRCGDANYCSRACQKSDWPKHKERCGLVSKVLQDNLWAIRTNFGN